MIDYHRFDESFDPPRVEIDLSGLPAPQVANGFHTLTLPCGSHRTFRVRTERNGRRRGTRSVALLIGPDNTDDYEAFGHLTPFGVQVWQRNGSLKLTEYAGILWELWNGAGIEGCTLLLSKRCFRCNRPLTDPESLELGVGPTCRTGAKS